MELIFVWLITGDEHQGTAEEKQREAATLLVEKIGLVTGDQRYVFI